MNLEQDPNVLDYIQNNHYGRLLNMDFSIIEPGLVEYTMKIQQEHLATPLAAHGGSIASLLDATLGVGAFSAVCIEDKVVSTIDMALTFLSPAFLNDTLTARSTVLKKGKRLLFMEAEVRNQNGVLIAKGSATMNAYPKEKAGY